LAANNGSCAVSSGAALRVEGIRKSFGRHVVLDGVSLDAAGGEFLALLGPSGCGKTTLLRVIAGLEDHEAGRVLIRENDVTRLPPARRECGIVFQSYALFPNLSAAANIAFGMRRSTPPAQRRAEVDRLLELVGLPGIGHKYPSQLSGGQQQRVAVARALGTRPALLLLDEPLSALDAKVRVHLRRELRRIQQTLAITTVMVTHDQNEALATADRVAVMEEGRIVQVGTPREIYQSPRHRFVADFLGAMNLLSGWTAGPDGRLERGSVRLSLAAPSAAREAGATLTVAFRPEQAAVAGPAEQSAGQNVLAARLIDVEFRGGSTRLWLKQFDADHSRDREGTKPADLVGSALRTDSPAPGITVRGADPTNAPARVAEIVLEAPSHEVTQYRIGDRIDVFIPPDKIRVFCDRTGAALFGIE
jgi:iron(III) transport system ATP-binding protein